MSMRGNGHFQSWTVQVTVTRQLGIVVSRLIDLHGMLRTELSTGKLMPLEKVAQDVHGKCKFP